MSRQEAQAHTNGLTEQLLQGPLKHIRSAALAAALVPLASVAAQPAHAQSCGSGGTPVMGYVWNDANSDGVQDLGELPLADQFVVLSWAGGEASVSTNEYGEYSFVTCPGQYQIAVSVPADWRTSPANSPSAGEDLDSDGVYDGQSKSYAYFEVPDTPSFFDIDFGLWLDQLVVSPGTATPGYWKTHPEAWPASIEVGGVTYSAASAIALISNTGSDKRFTLFDSLASAKLNVLMGNQNCVATEIASADAWMATAGSLSDASKKVKASSAAWRLASPWHQKLDDYNNGMLCAPHRN